MLLLLALAGCWCPSRQAGRLAQLEFTSEELAAAEGDDGVLSDAECIALCERTSGMIDITSCGPPERLDTGDRYDTSAADFRLDCVGSAGIICM